MGHELYDGKTYAFIRSLDINPADLEQVWWDGNDPDLFYYVDGKVFTRYRVSTDAKEAMHTFDFCSGGVAGDSHAFTSWSSNAVGLACDSTVFIYHLDTDQITGSQTSTKGPPHMGASGMLVYWEGDVTDLDLQKKRTLDLASTADDRHPRPAGILVCNRRDVHRARWIREPRSEATGAMARPSTRTSSSFRATFLEAMDRGGACELRRA